ncbi:hypothetical protein ACFQE1_19920, partial [Halobium palmae]
RGTDAFERAHEVAGLVDGGGHPKAAGCKPDIYDDMLDYAHHWTTEGATTKRVILAAFERVAERVEEEEDEGDDGNEGAKETDEDEGDVSDTAAVSEEATPDGGPDGDVAADHVATDVDE